MRAVVLKGFGSADNLFVSEVPIAEPSDNEVLIKTEAFSINPIDIKTRKGAGLAEALKNYDPLILGWDVSGRIVSTGKNVTRFRSGDDVFGMVNFPGYGKAYAEYVAAQESHLAHKPVNISHEEAAGASLAALTAWQILRYKANIKKGSAVLIHAAAGGVGHFAVQMARHLGTSVAATSSPANKRFLIELGTIRHIDYTVELFENILQNIDFVLDPVGGEYIDRSLAVLKAGGTIISINSGASADVKEKAAARGMNGLNFRVNSNSEDMNEIAGMLEKGIIRSVVSEVYSLNEVRKAHLQIESGRTRGKIVIKL